MYKILFKAILFLFLHIQNGVSKNEKYVRIGLDAKWNQTPLAFEASEFISSKSNDQYWNFIKSFSEQHTRVTDKDHYLFTIEKAAEVLSPIEVNALKFALSLRSFSPRVQLFQEIGSVKLEGCDIFYQVEEKQFCDLQKAFTFAKSFSGKSKKDVLVQDFDHSYPRSANKKVVFIFYADFTKESFMQSHNEIVSQLNDLNLHYVYRPIFKPSNSKVALSGYGVELSVKSTEYKAVDDQKVEDKKKKEELSDDDSNEEEIEGFLFKRLRELHPALQDDLDQYKKHLQESNKELAPLRVWQLQDLSFQASQRIRSASNQDALKVLRDLSQNAPMVARTLVKTKVNEDLRTEVKENQQEFESMGVAPGASALFVNGIEIDVDELSAHRLLDVVNNETGTMSEISKLKLELSKTGNLLALNIRPKTDELILDTRSEAVQFMNNLEKDSQYHYWPSNLNEILRPTFPGMMRYIAKNIFHIVAFVDPLSRECHKMLKHFDDLIENSFPARFGFVFVVPGSIADKPEENAGAAMLRAFSFIKTDMGINGAFNFIRKVHYKAGKKQPTAADIISYFSSLHGSSDAEEVLGANSEYDDLRKTSYQKYLSLGVRSLPQVMVNGESLDTADIFSKIEQLLVEKVLTQTAAVQQAVYLGSHHSYPSVYDYLMSQPNVVTRVNPLIQKVSGQYIRFNFQGNGNVDKSDFTKEEASSYMINNAKYFITDKGVSTFFVIINADTEDGRLLLLNAMKYVVKQKDVRLAVLLHGNNENKLTYNSLFQIILNFREKLISGVAKFIIKVLESEVSLEKLVESEAIILAAGITGINKKKLSEALESKETLAKAQSDISNNAKIVTKVLEITNNEQNYVIANGRVIGPLSGNDVFLKEDFDLLQDFENGRCGYKITEIINKMKLPDMPSEGHERYKSDLAMAVISLLSKVDSDVKRTTFSYKDDQHSVIHLPAQNNDIPSLDIDAILDPLSKGAQKLASILPVLHESFNANLKIFLNPKEKHSEMPVNRFYQYVLQSELQFAKDGSLLSDQVAMFASLPHSALLTLIMDTPQSWLIEAVGANHDLDNIHLGQAEGVVYGDFELENIIVQGSCSDANSHQHPRGLQFVLGTEAQPDMFDTIVMANLGYFQLKAYPGLFVLQLRDGRSSQIYQIHSLTGGKVLNEGHNYTIAVDSFEGKFLKVKVNRQEGKENEDLLGGEGGADDSDDIFGIWSSLASYVKTPGKSGKSTTDGKIHIFSVATGLLYERFLRIMMLSVLKHTKTPVKFWFLKNYLSAGFTSFLPRYAETYGFEYELVQYQWPKWLNGQTEKQRIIWGYKILFLDVLFPLNLDRIIFVDADQIVRADLKELMDMDLEGAPYAYTPFCNDRPEVEGFRFWNQGYWRNHLAGRPYHISALYVVDLKRFRRVAAGDRLRGQYQGLSQDPNSLSNLDQDLPNNMIHQVQIKSLPQEWLWCETWCSDESKERAKTIDMCNNPQTKEPKLQRAIRIAPEWVEYDEIIKSLMVSNTTSSTDSHRRDNDRPDDEL